MTHYILHLQKLKIILAPYLGILVPTTLFQETKITISAQLYLQKFYESHGFVVVGESYLEDDIPHIEMKRV